MNIFGRKYIFEHSSWSNIFIFLLLLSTIFSEPTNPVERQLYIYILLNAPKFPTLDSPSLKV